MISIKTVIATRDDHADDIVIRDPLRGKTIEKMDNKQYAQLLEGRTWCYSTGSLCIMHKREFKIMFGFTPGKGSKHEIFLRSTYERHPAERFVHP